MLYYFSEYNYRGNHAGTKARNDVEKILHQVDAKPINSSTFVLHTDDMDEHIYSSIRNRFDLIRLFFDAWKVKNRKIVVQYPMLAFDFQKKYFAWLSKHNELVLLIHDLHSLRIPNEEKLRQEIDLLNMASALIVHNRFMEQKLRKLGVSVSKIYCLEMFDYLHTGKLNSQYNKKNSIAFAGNLGKSIFLSEMIEKNQDIEFRLYGSGWNDSLTAKNAIYCGSFKPEIIPEKLEAGFGLVWDGESIMDGAGPLGEYTKINNPHKLSLYVSAGLPVIVWENAAVAEVVKKYHIGITVTSIDRLKNTLDNISEKEYETMKKNVLTIQEKLVQGEYLKKILRQL